MSEPVSARATRDPMHYLNTDLDLESAEDLTQLGAALEARGLFAMHVVMGDDDRWYATFESGEQADEPQPNIETMLDALESLPEDLQVVLAQCDLRALDIGYECGEHPWGFNQELSNDLLRRVARLGLCLRITLYPQMTSQDGGAEEELHS